MSADVDRLYQAPLEEFTRARNELAAQVKAAGEAAKAVEIKALAKPTVSAWAVNQLFWKARREYDALMKAGERLRDVQQAVLEGRRGDLRKVSEARQEALVAALDRAMRLAADAGHPAPPGLHQRVAKTLEALAAYGSSPPDTTAGRLSQDLDPPGFGVLVGLANLDARPASPEAPPATQGAASMSAKSAGVLARANALPHDRDVARARAELADAVRRQAAEREEAARQDVDEAHRTLEGATERAKKAAEDLYAAERQAATAEQSAQDAEKSVTAARIATDRRQRRAD